jgi:hypothetical protein
MVPLPSLKKFYDSSGFGFAARGLIEEEKTWELYGPYVERYGLTREEAETLQRLNDSSPVNTWERVFKYVEEQALKEVPK